MKSVLSSEVAVNKGVLNALKLISDMFDDYLSFSRQISGIPNEFEYSNQKPTEGAGQNKNENSSHVLYLQRFCGWRFNIVTEGIDILVFPPFVVQGLDDAFLLKVQDGTGQFVTIR